jgi:hypothetical protein
LRYGTFRRWFQLGPLALRWTNSFEAAYSLESSVCDNLTK